MYARFVPANRPSVRLGYRPSVRAIDGFQDAMFVFLLGLAAPGERSELNRYASVTLWGG